MLAIGRSGYLLHQKLKAICFWRVRSFYPYGGEKAHDGSQMIIEGKKGQQYNIVEAQRFLSSSPKELEEIRDIFIALINQEAYD